MWYAVVVFRLLVLGLVLCFLDSCQPRALIAGVYFWKTTLEVSQANLARWGALPLGQLGLRLFDWGVQGEEGPLHVAGHLPASLTLVPVVYVTTARLDSWATMTPFDELQQARELLQHIDRHLEIAGVGFPRSYQLDADWTARTRARWFAVVSTFRTLVHGRGATLTVTVRLHQYRDRATQGVPPADDGVLMLYGTGDSVLDPATIEAYVRGPAYPIPLVPAFPTYSQVRQYNGYNKLVSVSRLGSAAELPQADLQKLPSGRFRVLRRSLLGGRPLLQGDELAVDLLDASTLDRARNLPAVAELMRRSGGRVWFFDDDPASWPMIQAFAER